MTSDTPKKTSDDNTNLDADSIYVRSIFAWMLLIVPGLLIALLSGKWLLFFFIGPVVVSPFAVWAYDLAQFLKKTWRRSKKLILLPVIGLVSALLVSSVGTQVHIGHSNLAEAEALIANAHAGEVSLDGLRLSKQELQRALQLLQTVPSIPGAGAPIARSKIPAVQAKLASLESQLQVEEQTFQQTQQAATALENAKQIAKQAGELVKAPPYPLSVWETALQQWEESLKVLNTVSENSPAYEEASAKVTAYQANHRAIAQRIETERRAAISYEISKKLLDEVVELTGDIGYPSTEKLPALQLTRAKLDTALRFLKGIPSGTAVSEAARLPISTHSEDYRSLQSTIKKLEDCDASSPSSCIIYQFISIRSSFAETDT